uniref:PCI domain-containing protein 2 homolog n=1 Tax=Acrobeloides nanus TaxID=290746 RepID=A0A914EKZ6_9BILA
MIMFSSFQEYLKRIDTFLYDSSWSAAEKIAQLISCRDGHVECRTLWLEDADSKIPNRYVIEWGPMDDIVVLHAKVLYLIHEDRFEDAYFTQAAMLQIFNREILQKEKDTNWFMPILYTLCSDLRLLAKTADSKPSKHRKSEAPSFYEEAANPIMESYRICVAESRVNPDTTKKIGILNLTNHLFRIYFKINRLHLLKPLIRSIDHIGELYERFSMADKITYKYFLGRKAMFDSDLGLAERSLTYAFVNCPKTCRQNKRLILMYLIPVKMFLGHMPTQELLKKYELEQFSDVVSSVKVGNLKKLDEALEEHRNFFIECGIYLMLEKLKIITYRTLFKKVASILGTLQIKLDVFIVALRWLGDDMDVAELSCILANLIAQKKIKGYISWHHQTLVIGKVSPFPPLSTLS